MSLRDVGIHAISQRLTSEQIPGKVNSCWSCRQLSLNVQDPVAQSQEHEERGRACLCLATAESAVWCPSRVTGVWWPVCPGETWNSLFHSHDRFPRGTLGQVGLCGITHLPCSQGLSVHSLRLGSPTLCVSQAWKGMNTGGGWVAFPAIPVFSWSKEAKCPPKCPYALYAALGFQGTVL